MTVGTAVLASPICFVHVPLVQRKGEFLATLLIVGRLWDLFADVLVRVVVLAHARCCCCARLNYHWVDVLDVCDPDLLLSMLA